MSSHQSLLHARVDTRACTRWKVGVILKPVAPCKRRVLVCLPPELVGRSLPRARGHRLEGGCRPHTSRMPPALAARPRCHARMYPLEGGGHSFNSAPPSISSLGGYGDC